MPRYDVLTVAQPIVDRIIQVPEAFLKRVDGRSGGSTTIPLEQLDALIEASGAAETQVPGGAASNTLRGLAHFGRSGAIIGKIGQDPIGQCFKGSLKNLPITSLLHESTSPSAQAVILVTPDGERTQRCFLGAAGELTPEELDPSHFADAGLLFLEGYILYQKALGETAIKIAREQKVPVALGLASFELVDSKRELILDLLTTSVDIVICNKDEGKALTGLQPETASKALAKLCQVAVVTHGDQGCWVASGKKHFHTPVTQTEPVDATGGGDLFASGFLEAYMGKHPLEVCAKLGCIAGREAVQVLGSDLSTDGWRRVLDGYSNLIS